MKRLVIGICLAFLSGPALAQVAPEQVPPEITAIDAKLKACLDKSGGVTMVLNTCNEEAQNAADKILNHLYGAWIEDLKHADKDEAKDSAEILKRLVASERAWIAYRDTGCNLESVSMLGGTGETTVYGSCQYAKTRQRVLDLKDIQASR